MKIKPASAGTHLAIQTGGIDITSKGGYEHEKDENKRACSDFDDSRCRINGLRARAYKQSHQLHNQR